LRDGHGAPTSPPFSPPLKSAERNPQKGAADDVGAEDQHPDQQSRFHVSGPFGGARSAAGPSTRNWLSRAWLSLPTGLSQSNPSRFNLDAGSYCPRVFRGDGRPASPRRLQPLAKFFHCALAQKTGLRSPVLASSMILLAISSFAISPRSASPRHGAISVPGNRHTATCGSPTAALRSGPFGISGLDPLYSARLRVNRGWIHRVHAKSSNGGLL
jgi:hypothetical protein